MHVQPKEDACLIADDKDIITNIISCKSYLVALAARLMSG